MGVSVGVYFERDYNSRCLDALTRPLYIRRWRLYERTNNTHVSSQIYQSVHLYFGRLTIDHPPAHSILHPPIDS